MKNKKRWFVAVPVIFIIAMLWHTFSQPGLNDFISNFEEVDLYRNENNTGPVERVYIVTTTDSIWNEMERYAGLMPYSKLGTTSVYFFLKDKPYPQKAQSGRVSFDPSYEQYCLASYQKNSFGATSFAMFPFKK
ncbi:hypothetical protein BFP97_17015 [Roseivirga sp. 4D4]|uniref:hypothetical protein n=1 Tax=Roseivirga sp. 4D4 TaxID=1889784 RepID=UPI000852E7E8|nr:hypothetical protein [Roseivirga sp. 4D4]OEK03117.1 hypothetical protein BFP97_17015 [Roseivirga sp. 4D4]